MTKLGSRWRAAVSAKAHRQDGYVLLAALVVAAMGLAAAFAAFALAEAAGRIATADGGAERALSAAHAGVVDAADRLAWGGLPDLWRGAAACSFDADVGESCAARVTVRRLTVGAAAEPVFEVASCGTSGAAAATVRATLAAQPLGLPRGLNVAGDLRTAAALSVSGSGIYAGGDVWGREHIVFCGAAGEAGSGPDRAQPERWPVAALHAAGQIYGAGREVHEQGTAAADDTDVCTGPPSGRDAWPPDAEALALICAHATVVPPSAPGEPVDLAALAARLGTIRTAEPQSGAVVVVRSEDEPVALTGWWPQTEDTAQITLLVLGDAVLEEGGEGVGAALRGALLVTGRLRVATPSLIVGFVAADELLVEAPLSVVLHVDWREQPPPGSFVLRRAGGTGAVWSPAGAKQRAGRRRSGMADGEGRTRSYWLATLGPAGPPPASGSAFPAGGGRSRAQSAPTGALSEMNTMVSAPVRQYGVLFAVWAPGIRGTLKQSSRVADVGACMAKERSTRGV